MLDLRASFSEIFDDICWSGGSAGADSAFTAWALKSDHGAINFSFQNHKHDVPPETVIILKEIDLHVADQPLSDANKILKRRFPTSSTYTNNLLRRNYHQILYSDRIYAVTPIETNGLPRGGTGWTIVMGVLQGIREVYVFDCEKLSWWKKVGFGNSWEWVKLDPFEIPKPHGMYTGIGSHDLTIEGYNAINQLYQR